MAVTLAIDCMRGDHGPTVTVPAALDFLRRDPDCSVILVGRQEVLQPLLGGAQAEFGARLRVGTMYLETLKKARSNRTIFEDFFHKSYELIEPELRDVLQRKALESDPAVLLNDMLCCDRFDIMDRVHEIRLPTLALCGSEDVMTPPKYTKYLASKIEGARYVIIEGGTHMVFAEQPRAVNQAIEDYLDSL